MQKNLLRNLIIFLVAFVSTCTCQSKTADNEISALEMLKDCSNVTIPEKISLITSGIDCMASISFFLS